MSSQQSKKVLESAILVIEYIEDESRRGKQKNGKGFVTPFYVDELCEAGEFSKSIWPKVRAHILASDFPLAQNMVTNMYYMGREGDQGSILYLKMRMIKALVSGLRRDTVSAIQRSGADKETILSFLTQMGMSLNQLAKLLSLLNVGQLPAEIITEVDGETDA